MYQVFAKKNVLGQFQPFLTPTMPILDQANGISSPDAAPATTGGPAKAAVLGTTLVASVLGATSAVFLYGVAKESPSRMVKTTGYILSGVSALSAIAYLVGGSAAALMAGVRK